MRCTSPLYRVNNSALWGDKVPPLFLKKRFFSYRDYFWLVNKKGYAESAFTRINCGQCLSCRILNAKQWAERCFLESQFYDSNYFFTLTYDDEHLPIAECGAPTLRKRDFQLFMKRLRKSFETRYFACGEYGDNTYRPHYHSLMFGLKLNDLVPYKTVKKKNNVYTYYNSPQINEIWGKGYVVITNLTADTCAYTARYCMKKVGFNTNVTTNSMRLEDPNLTDEDYHKGLQGCGLIEPIFSLQSRRPGIGRNYYELNKNVIYDIDNIPMSTLKHIRYFDKLFEVEQPVRMQGIKEARQLAICETARAKSSYTEVEYFDIERAAAKAKREVRGN
ncbi:replication initiator protein [Microvirus mar17]|uniref:Replication initiator protein n=1 Tax=Microvirus mar17 TaxID=2851149 RepID=A0A8F5RBP9_9VIRU|nr:replication initiator protein [Microvirus mar17]